MYNYSSNLIKETDMNFYHDSVLYHVNTKKPNIILLPKGVLFWGGAYESLPPQAIPGNFFVSLFKLITLQGGVTKATLV
jgi:hypothetical protein